MNAPNPLPCGCYYRQQTIADSESGCTVFRGGYVVHCPLCAAAGQLLEACKAFVAAENHDGMQLAYTMARDAIAAAEGRA